MRRKLSVIAFISFCLPGALFVCDSRPDSHGIRLNPDALQFAQQLIAHGHVARDKVGQWRIDRPSAETENEFITRHGFAEYAKWHLGIDQSHAEDSKARYKFPFGDFTSVHRCGVIAAQNRARQFGYMDIADAAADLRRAIDRREPNLTTPSETRR